MITSKLMHVETRTDTTFITFASACRYQSMWCIDRWLTKEATMLRALMCKLNKQFISLHVIVLIAHSHSSLCSSVLGALGANWSGRSVNSHVWLWWGCNLPRYHYYHYYANGILRVRTRARDKDDWKSSNYSTGSLIRILVFLTFCAELAMFTTAPAQDLRTTGFTQLP